MQQNTNKIYFIYRIYNLINNKSYIGFTSQNLMARLKQHCYASTHHKNRMQIKIHNAIRKYGKDNFFIEELFSSTDKDLTLKTKEQEQK